MPSLDFYAAYVRSCVDGDFYDGGQWLYRGQSMAQVLKARGAAYALWGCVGSWFSGRNRAPYGTALAFTWRGRWLAIAPT